MREIKKLEKEQLKEALKVAAKAYPVLEISSTKKLDELESNILKDFNTASRTWFALFEDGQILGNMVLYDFVLNYYGQEIKARGIGFVAVEMLHKKQHVCRDMLQWYLTDSQKKGYPLAILYSFRPDFYKQMGFGYSTACYNYVSQPQRMPKADKEYPMQYLGLDDKADVLAFYHAIYSNNHGMIRKKEKDIENLLKAEDIHRVGYKENGLLCALLVFRLVANDSTNQSTHMKLNLLFINSNGLRAALNFLNSQADQVTEIAFSTPYRDFFFNLADIRHMDHRILQEPGYHHVYDAGMGIMSRSLNPVELILKRPSSLDNLRIRFLLQDSFMPQLKNDFVIEWKAGKASLSRGKKHDLELRFGVAEFSSWIMNAMDLFSLHQYGLVELSDESWLLKLDKAFYYHQKPLCLERF